MCAALELPIKRGEDKAKQLEDLGKLYRITIKKNGSFELTRKNRAMRSEEKKSKKIASGQIVSIDGMEVDLKGRGKYKDTGIYDYVYFKTFSGVEFSPWEFSQECFRGMIFYSQRYCFEDRSDIDTNCKERVKTYGESMILIEIKAIVRSILTSLDKNKDYDFQLKSCYVMSNGRIVLGDEAEKIGRLYSGCIRIFTIANKSNPYCMHENEKDLLEDVKTDYFHISKQNEVYPKKHRYHMQHSQADSEPSPSPGENEEILYKFFGVLRETLKFKVKQMKTTACIAVGPVREEMLTPVEQKLLIEYFDYNIRLDPGLPIYSCEEDILLVSSTLPALPDFITPNSGHFEYY